MNTAADANVSRIAKLIDKQIYALRGRKSQKEIAEEAGFKSPNIISMFKKGQARVALDRVPSLARALEVDMVTMFMLALEQDAEGLLGSALKEIFHTLVTENEAAILKVIRTAANDTNPALTPEVQVELAKIFSRFT